MLVATALLLVVTGCTSDAESSSDDGAETDGAEDAAAPSGEGEDPEDVIGVTLGGIPVTDLAYVEIAQREGYFDEVGLSVDVEYAGGATALVPALTNGQYDIIWGGLLTGLRAADTGLPIRAIAASSRSTGIENEDLSAILARDDAGIDSAADLPGRRIAVNEAGGPHEVQNEVLFDQLGVDSSGITYVELPIPSMVQALEAGQVDAVTIPEPFLTAALTQGGFTIVESTPNAWNPDIYTSAFYVTQETLESRPDLVDRFLVALRQSYEYAAANPEGMRDATGAITEIDPDVLQEMAYPANEWDGQADAVRAYGEAVLGVDAISRSESVDELIADVMP